MCILLIYFCFLLTQLLLAPEFYMKLALFGLQSKGLSFSGHSTSRLTGKKPLKAIKGSKM